jgi:simple sugar transport system permease protein
MKKILTRIAESALLPFLSVLMAFFISGILIVFSDTQVLKVIGSPLKFIQRASSSVFHSYVALFEGAFFDPNLAQGHSLWQGFYPLSETIVTATPLILAGLAVTLAFQAGLFNIGAQGQFIFGALGASYIGFHYSFPPVIHVILALLAGVFASSLWGGFVGFLKAKTGAHEVIVTIMMNYIAGFFILWALKTHTFLRPRRIDPLAPEVQPNAQLPHLLGTTMRLHAGIIIALLAAVFVWWLLNKTTIGFQFRAVGANASAAKTAGISVSRTTILTMTFAGALAGLGGAVHVLGSQYALTADIAGSFGFDAITVALLGRGKPTGTVFAALLFGALRTGGRTMEANTNTPLDIVLVIQALIVLFVASPSMVRFLFRVKNLRSQGTLASKGWNS